MLNFFEIPKLNGSKNVNNDVNPAKKTVKKNNGSRHNLYALILNILGNITNNRPVPLAAISFNAMLLSFTIKPVY